MKPENKLQQELINLLIQLKNHVSTPDERAVLTRDIESLETKAQLPTNPNKAINEIWCYLALLIGHCPTLNPHTLSSHLQHFQGKAFTAMPEKSKEKHKKNPKA